MDTLNGWKSARSLQEKIQMEGITGAYVFHIALVKKFEIILYAGKNTRFFIREDYDQAELYRLIEEIRLHYLFGG